MSTDMQKANGSDTNPQAGTETAARIAHDFVDRVAKIAGQSEEKLRKVSTKAEDSVKQSLETARGKLDVARTNLNTKSGEVKTSVTGFVQEHPLAAIGIAFGTGVLLSYLTRGSRRVERDDNSA
jgi:ElaB/YqjD/DUF883 family membrane-anchored ribosome-binding protein